MRKAKSSKAEPSESTGVFVQVTPLPPGGVVTPQSVKGTIRKIGPEQLQAASAVVADIHKWLFAKLKEIGPEPDTVSLEFGIDAQAEAGIPFITKGTIGANFRVSMEWQKNKPEGNR
ncbi:hypothetical protein L0156_28730 [bacterium]|nr:hypothetical protein [bacterium]